MSRNVIDWSSSQGHAALTVQSYLDVDEAEKYMLIEYGDTAGHERVVIGDDLVVGLKTTRDERPAMAARETM